ncbi:unnamed protein product [Cuscuta campestris]|uniref:Uncharacterized protein n=1 Tax=Cuscuta campestris TaxID=132261 RepID=A0A484MZH8_9ASTE|nr:unnamed protein product [Cuscuta campestris]
MEGLSFEDQKAQRFGSDPPFSQTKDVPPADMPFSFKHMNDVQFFKLSFSSLSASEPITEPPLCALPEIDNDNPDPELLKRLLKQCVRDLDFYTRRWQKNYEDAMKSYDQQDGQELAFNWIQARYSGRKVLEMLELEHRLKDLMEKEDMKAIGGDSSGGGKKHW